MRKIKVYYNGIPAGEPEEIEKGKNYVFRYYPGYNDEDISLTMPRDKNVFESGVVALFFDGLLPEGIRLEQLLKIKGLDRNDLLSLLINSGKNLKGSIEVKEIE